jgi:hypothetical protein
MEKYSDQDFDFIFIPAIDPDWGGNKSLSVFWGKMKGGKQTTNWVHYET